MRKGLLIFISLTMASQAMAGPAIRCENVLISKTQLAQKWLKEIRLSRHDRGLERALKRGDQYLEEWVQQRFILAYGKRLSLKDYIHLSKDQRAQKLLYRMWQEKVVVEGLDSYAKMMELQTQVTNRNKVNYAVRKSLSVFWKIISLPGVDLRDTAATSDMLSAWINDGSKKHTKAIDKYLYEKSFVRPKGQSQLERYNYLKSAWVKIVLLSWVYLTIVNWDEDQKEAKEKIENALHEAEQKRIEEKIVQFESEILGVKSEIDEMLKDYIHKSFAALYQRYLKEYHEEPTADEIREMIKISYRDYGIDLPDNEVSSEKTP